MRVLINAVGLSVGGGRRVGLGLIGALIETRGTRQLKVLTPSGPDYAAVCAGVEHRSYSRGRGFPVWRVWFDQVVVPRLGRSFQADVIVSLGNLGPVYPGRAHAILFHNPYYIYPWRDVRQLLAPGARLVIRGQMALFAWSLPRAGRVMVQTDVARRRLESRYGLPADRLVLVPNPMAELGVLSSPTQRAADRAEGPCRVFVLAHYYPHKNLEFVVDLAGRLRDRGEQRFVFVLTIAANQHPRAAALLDRIDREGLGDLVENIGPVAADRLATEYASADIVFLPTRLESFSATYLEAMRYGVPILTSRLDFAVDCCGDAARYCSPDDPDDAATALIDLWEDPASRQELASRGRTRLERFRFSFADAAGRVYDTLEAAVIERGR